MLPEKTIVVESVEGDSVGSGLISPAPMLSVLGKESYSFRESNCDFFGIISSICGASRG